MSRLDELLCHVSLNDPALATELRRVILREGHAKQCDLCGSMVQELYPNAEQMECNACAVKAAYQRGMDEAQRRFRFSIGDPVSMELVNYPGGMPGVSVGYEAVRSDQVDAMAQTLSGLMDWLPDVPVQDDRVQTHVGMSGQVVHEYLGQGPVQQAVAQRLDEREASRRAAQWSAYVEAEAAIRNEGER